MKEDVLFKKTPFGGFDRIEVISYIQQLKETQHKYKLMLEEKDALVKRLERENALLSGQADELRQTAEESSRRVSELENELKGLKAKCDMLSKKAEQNEKQDSDKKLAENTVKLCDELVETASVTARGIIQKAEKEYNGVREKIDSVAEQIAKAKTMPAKDIKALMKQLSEELNNG